MALIPKDLQRFRIDGQNITPQYIKATPSIIEMAENILDCFRYAPSDTYGILRDSLDVYAQTSQRHRLIRGFIHILEARLEFEDNAAVAPSELRRMLFQKAGALEASSFDNRTWRDAIFNEVAAQTGISAAELESRLYSDLKDERVIVSFDDLSSEELVAEYNLALAKSLIGYARSLVFTIVFENSTAQGVRRLFRALRFFNLLFDAQPITDQAWQFTVDGPSAVLAQPQKYAMSLASFLPQLFAFHSWHATAQVEWDKKNYTWQIQPKDIDMSHHTIPERIPEEAQTLASRIADMAPEWRVHRDCPFITFGPQAVWVPDFSIENAQKDGQPTVHVEVLGSWRADYLNRRLALLEHYKPKNLILVLSDKLRADASHLSASAVSVVFYKRTPLPKDIIACAKKLGL